MAKSKVSSKQDIFKKGVNIMKKLLYLILCLALPIMCWGVIDTFEGVGVTTSTYIEGVNTTDTIEGQTLKAGPSPNILVAMVSPANPTTPTQKPSTAISNYCSSGTPGDPMDVFCEDSEGGNTIETGATDWTKAQNAGWVDWDSPAEHTMIEAPHTDTLNCAGKGDYAIEIHVVDTTGNEEMEVNLDIANKTTLYGQIYFNITDTTGVDSGDDYGLFSFCFDEDGNCNSIIVVVGLTYIAPNWKVGMIYSKADETNSAMTFNGTPTAVAVNTWHRLGIKFVQGSEITVYLNGASEITTADVTDIEDVKSVGFGSNGIYTIINNDAATFQVDLLAIDDDAMPGACTP